MPIAKGIVDARNAAIYKRFKVLYHEQHYQSNWCATLLSKEFFIGEETIKKVISAERKKDTSLTQQPA